MCFWKKSSSFEKMSTWPGPVSLSSWGGGLCVDGRCGGVWWYLPQEPGPHLPITSLSLPPDLGGLPSVGLSYAPLGTRMLYTLCIPILMGGAFKGRYRAEAFRLLPVPGPSSPGGCLSAEDTTSGENSWAGRRNPPTTIHLGDLLSCRQDFWNHKSFLRPLTTLWLLAFPNFCLFESEFSCCLVN